MGTPYQNQLIFKFSLLLSNQLLNTLTFQALKILLFILPCIHTGCLIDLQMAKPSATGAPNAAAKGDLSELLGMDQTTQEFCDAHQRQLFFSGMVGYDLEDPRPQRVDPNPMCGGRMIRAQGYPPPACPCCGGDMQWRHQEWPPAEETCRSCAATRRHRTMTIDPATQEA